MRRLTFLFVVLAAGLAACGAGDDPAGDTIGNAITGGTPAPVATAPAPAATATQAAAPQAKPAARGVGLAQVGSFDSPVYLTAPPGDRSRVFVVSQKGRVWIVKNGRRLATPFLDISSKVACCGEQGLLSIAFAPDYASSKRRSTSTTPTAAGPPGSPSTGLAARPPIGRSSSSRRLGASPSPSPRPTTTAASSSSGPTAALHRPRRRWRRRRPARLARQRPEPRHAAGQDPAHRPARRRRPAVLDPGRQPVRGQPGARPEIYSYGLRNPWRFSFDRRDRRSRRSATSARTASRRSTSPARGRRGVNYGWRVCEGYAPLHSAASPRRALPPPVLDYPPRDGECSVTGGYVVRDPLAAGPATGRYVYGDYCAWAAAAPCASRRRRSAGDRRLGAARRRRSPRSARTAAAGLRGLLRRSGVSHRGPLSGRRSGAPGGDRPPPTRGARRRTGRGRPTPARSR